jgi:hypothetical protein
MFGQINALAIMAAHGMALREMSRPLVIEPEPSPVAPWREEAGRIEAEMAAKRERADAFGKAAMAAAEAKRARKAARRLT